MAECMAYAMQLLLARFFESSRQERFCEAPTTTTHRRDVCDAKKSSNHSCHWIAVNCAMLLVM